MVGEENSVEMELGTLISDNPVECCETCAHCDDGCQVDILLRPDDIVHDDASPVQAEVLHKAFRGADILYTLRLASGTEVLSLVPSHHNHALGEKIGIRLDADHVIAFKREDGCDDPACEDPDVAVNAPTPPKSVTWHGEKSAANDTR
jgi:iron(III) transport system ATP-binding protein